MPSPPEIPEGYPSIYVQCRLNHLWEEVQSTKLPSWGFLQTFRCQRCKGLRYDTIDMLGNLSTRQYSMPDGYALPKGLRRADFRLRLAQTSEADRDLLRSRLRQRRELEQFIRSRRAEKIARSEKHAQVRRKRNGDVTV